MTKQLRSLLFVLSTLICISANAQIEVAHLTSKSFDGNGFGGFLNFEFPVTEGNSISAEFGIYRFKDHGNEIAMGPFLLGYRYTLDGSGTGFYIEPTAGYTIGASDIPKKDENGYPAYDDERNEWVHQKAQGITAGICGGYIIGNNFKINIGLRYQHVFVSGDPSLNMFSLRLSHSFSFGRKSDY